MKRLFTIYALLVMFVTTGCELIIGGGGSDLPENIFFELNKEEVSINPDGGNVEIVVYSNYKWEISGTSDWCAPLTTEGDANENGQTVVFDVEPTDLYDAREAIFWFRCSDKQIKLTITQEPIDFDLGAYPYYIEYTTTDGKAVTPFVSEDFDATFVANVYKAGRGYIVFDAPIRRVGKEAFASSENLLSVVIPEGVTVIGLGAFSNCNSLTSVTLPYGVESLEDMTFSNCKSLTNITLPETITSMGFGALAAGANLRDITIPQNITAIAQCLCQGCGIESITIPSKVTSIGAYAYYPCVNLAKVYCMPTIPPQAIEDVGWDAFDRNAEGRKIYVPTESVEAYKTAEGWSDYADSIVGYDF